MFINVNVRFFGMHMLAADLEGTALRIGCEKQKFHDRMNLWKWGLGIANKSWQQCFSLTQIIVMWEQLNYI